MMTVWERYSKELLNQGGNSSTIVQFPKYVERKAEVVDISDTNVQTARKRAKAGSTPGIGEVRVTTRIRAGEIGASWRISI